MSASDITYNVPSGIVTLYAGRYAPVVAPPPPPPPLTGLPLWAATSELYKPVMVPNSAGAGGAQPHVFGGFAFREDTGELFSSLNGGHEADDNRVVSYPLYANSPAGWDQRCAPSPVRVIDVSHYPDGKPTSRHVYDNVYWVPTVNRILHVGCIGAFGQPWNFFTVDAFNPDTNTWEPAQSWPNTPMHAHTWDPFRNRIWTRDHHIFDPVARTFSAKQPKNIGGRFPCIYDWKRDQFFNLQWGDGYGYAPATYVASKWPAAGGGQQVAITFAASPAFTQFQADEFYPSAATGSPQRTVNVGMCYDEINDCFYWYSGIRNQVNHIYKIIPNDGTVWNMEMLPWAAGSVSLPETPVGGMCGRIKYIKQLKGFIVYPSGTGAMYYVRTAN